MACVATGAVQLLEVPAHVGPIERVANEPIGFISTKVAHGIVTKVIEGFADVRDARDAETITNEEEAVANANISAGLPVKETSAQGVEGVDRRGLQGA